MINTVVIYKRDKQIGFIWDKYVGRGSAGVYGAVNDRENTRWIYDNYWM